MKTRCKFYCYGVSQNSIGFTANLRPVYTGSEENEEFYSSTPCGILELSVTKKQHFEVDKEYYLDISLAPEETYA